ncbi:hypothetical protein PAHAL_6G235000 [Panicum hallii]|uniref:Uncharacterized protein n=1 Tax=Panicum hallii TaxID=206008 RepID=A0A2T8IHB3_9POAL|nr:abscisic acid 8'-hydroxylase 3-like isoform X2 [Panicum hallii]PVH37070.1 hypothetical protein PAHAL_6G235000 [Panicum hallii]
MAFFLLAVACACYVSSLAVLVLLGASRRRRGGAGRSGGPARGLKLPPGSLGLPYIGETLQLYSQNPRIFFAARLKRYGEVFKTHVLGCPCVVLATPEAARMVLVSRAHLFRPTYPPSKERMIGPQALFFHQGDYHLRMRRVVQGWLGPDALRALVPDVEAAVASTLRWWEGRETSTFHTMKRLTFDVGVVTIFGRRMAEHVKEELRRNYFTVERGYNSFPIPVLPWTRYSQAIKARKRLGAILSGILSERRARDDLGDDLLGTLMRYRDDGGAALSDDQVADNVLGVLFAAQDTTASVLTWVLKFLHDHPKLLEAVKAEQMAAYEENDGGRLPLTWAQTKRMPMTQLVILESLRLASIITFTFREAVEDVDYEGGAQARHVPAVRERRARVPRERPGQARDGRPRPPPRHQLQVAGDRVERRRDLQPLPRAEARPPGEAAAGDDWRRGGGRPPRAGRGLSSSITHPGDGRGSGHPESWQQLASYPFAVPFGVGY